MILTWIARPVPFVKINSRLCSTSSRLLQTRVDMISCRASAAQHRTIARPQSRFAGVPLRAVLPRSQVRSRFCVQAAASPEILQKVKTIVGKQLGVEDDKVKEDSKFVDDLGADSLDAVEMVMALEDEFGVEIGEESAEKLASVQEAADAIAGELAKK